jgi:hypothetical protein
MIMMTAEASPAQQHASRLSTSINQICTRDHAGHAGSTAGETLKSMRQRGPTLNRDGWWFERVVALPSSYLLEDFSDVWSGLNKRPLHSVV